MKQRKYFSTNLILSIPFISLVVFSFFTVSILAYYGSKNSIYALVDKLSMESMQRINEHFNLYFEKPHIINKINNDKFKLDEINTEILFEKPEKFFYPQHFQFHDVSDIYFGRKDGAICGVDEEQGKYILKLTSDFPKRNFYTLDDNGNRGEIIKTNTYDSVSREWFKKALKENVPIWSSIYVLQNRNQLGITAASSTYNSKGEFEGVMGVNLTLDGISDFLNSTKISPNTTLFILEKDGNLVASSIDEPLFKTIPNEEKPKRINAIEANNQLISTISKKITDEYKINSIQDDMLQTKFNNENYVVRISNYKDKFGLDFIIVMAINEKDFMGGVNQTIKNSFSFGILLLIVLIIITKVFSNKLTQPIAQLSSEANSIANGNFGSKIDINTNSKEIYSLIQSFNSMSLNLRKSFDNLQNINQNLETIVFERTKELQIINEELNSSQAILNEAHKNIRDSISYGSLIQHTLLPNNKLFLDYFQESFTIWEPKDTVGGDIYLFENINENEAVLFVIDCTGHGVPGAFVTMLVKAIERQVISNIILKEEISPSKILSFFNVTIKKLLKQENDESISNAGFDGGILYYNKKNRIIKYSGANTPLFIVENGELNTIKGDRHSIGYKKSDANFVFKEHILEVRNDMQFYLTTDGYLDQNGGEKDFPLGKKRFEEILLKYNNKCLNDIQKALIDNLVSYQGNQDRNDDITIVGMKI